MGINLNLNFCAQLPIMTQSFISHIIPVSPTSRVFIANAELKINGKRVLINNYVRIFY